MIGETLDGKYRMLRVLGQGGMGAVYEAEHTGTGRKVAVKVIVSEQLAKNDAMVRRFQREARTAGSVDTQHIVQVLDTGTDPGTGMPYMVMELLKGKDLDELVLALGPLSPGLALRLVGQACVGLVKAHEAGIVHRDIKPANLFLSLREDGGVVVKVLDFGIAKNLTASADELKLTSTGSMLGSPLYMSPEQAVGKKQLDHRTDVWSLGVVLYHALAGHAPNVGCDTLGALIMAICSDPAPPIQDVAPWVSSAVAALVHRALSIDAGARFPTMAAMLDAIRRLSPDGIDVREDALVPLGNAERARVATRAPVEAAPAIAPAPPASAAPLGEQVVRGVPAGSAPGVSVPANSAAGISAPGLGAPETPHAPRAKRGPWLAAAVALGLAGATFAAYRTTSHQGASPALAAVPGAEAPPPSAPIVTAATAAPRAVRVAIEPADASVEVDDHDAVVEGGTIAIDGAPGSVHKVRLRKGGAEITREVVVSESGAIPPRLELAATPAPTAKPGGPSSITPGTRPAAARAPATAAPATKAADPTVRRKFDD